MEKTKIIVMGGKGTAVNLAEGIYDAEQRYGAPVEFLGFAFDDESLGDSINGFPVLCKTRQLMEKYGGHSDVKFIFQMYREDKMVERARLIQSYQIPDSKYFTFIHPSAFVSRSVKLGVGNVVYAHCAIHANAVIGNHNMFSAYTSIGHDSVIHDHVFTATHVCIGSSVSVQDCTFVGQNASIRGGISVNGGNVIGMGANVVADISATGSVFLGNPARKTRELQQG